MGDLRDTGWPLGLGAILVILGGLQFIPEGTSIAGALMVVIGLGLLLWGWDG